MIRNMFRCLALLLICSLWVGCNPGRSTQTYGNDIPPGETHFQPGNLRFAVLADLHFYDNSLGTSGTAFEKYLDKDRKMLAQSVEILDIAVNRISELKPDFVIICGDLTKDGETVNHTGVASRLKRLEAAGVKAFVVPGNHDINNSHAFQYQGDEQIAVQAVSAADFRQIYSEFGYREALYQDTHSLSYVAQPEDDYWLLALDSCKHKENKPGEEPYVSGAISPGTLAWMKEMLILARKEKKTVLTFLHHGVVPHYPSNDKNYSEYILDNHETVAQMLAAHRANLVFTGHFHAQDITKKTFQDSSRFIFDIETGSIVSAPTPYRTIAITNGRTVTVNSHFITSIPSQENFTQFSKTHTYERTLKLVHKALDNYRVSKEQQQLIAPQITRAYCAHLNGDETAPDPIIDTEGFGLWLKFIAWFQQDLIHGWWTDLPPADNDLVIDLHTGDSYQEK